jgi:tetratricopeptide (TPR) repeat protein
LLKAVERAPNVAHAHDTIGLLWARRERGAEALDAFRRAHELDATDPGACRHLADAYMAVGDYASGFDVLERGLKARQRSRYLPIARHYAWRRATCPDAAYREGKLAEARIVRVLKLTNQATARDLQIKAAALADQGRYEEAVDLASEALELARRALEPRSVRLLQRQVEAYGAGRPWIAQVTMPTS